MKIYQSCNGNLEEFELLEEHNLNEGATEETYICRRKDGSKFVCAKDCVHKTKKEAILEDLKLHEESISAIKKEIVTLNQDLVRCEGIISKLNKLL